MSVRFASARSDEHGKSGWQGTAKAGDQTGREVSIQNWYKHPKGWVVLRPKDPLKAEMIARDMEWGCANKNIGYDQSQRLTLYYEAVKVGFNLMLIVVLCETDCSGIVRVCCCYAGIMVGNFRTANEVETLMATGEFELLDDPKYTDSPDYLKRGDILVTKTSGHTGVILDDGEKAKIGPYVEDGYMFEVKNVYKGCNGASVLLCQELLKVKGYKGKDGKVLSLDGDCGENTVYAINSFQTAMRKKGIELGTNGRNDGSCGPKCWKELLGL